MELKKILIDKIEGNKPIHRSNERRNLYKAWVEAYESDKIILDTYRDTITLKRRHDDDADKDEEPSVGPDRGSKRCREGKEPESASSLIEKATRSAGRSTQGTKSRQTSTSESATTEEPMQTTFEMEEPAHLELLQLLAGPTYELLKGSCKILVELKYHLEEVYKATTYQLDLVNLEGAISRKYTTSVTKTKAVNYGIVIQRRVEDLQLDVKSYQKKLNLTKSDTYRSDLKHKEAYIAYLNPLGFIYQNKEKKNMLMRIDELHKFSDGMLTNVRTALDDRLKGIRMQYLPQSM
nr:hypothetical protein [Tanacetum cinerariifolium]